MAFWETSGFPGYLCGEVESFKKEDPKVVKVKEYGGAYFRYKFLLPLELGLKLMEQLKSLEKDRIIAEKRFKVRVENIIKEFTE